MGKSSGSPANKVEQLELVPDDREEVDDVAGDVINEMTRKTTQAGRLTTHRNLRLGVIEFSLTEFLNIIMFLKDT